MSCGHVIGLSQVAGGSRRLKKKKPSSKAWFVCAEEEGFEPPVPHGTTVFKTAAIDHSATPLCLA
jgi:hypothetical protein